MSKAFTSEETPDGPVVVPARPPLPAGVPNYVTARGLGLLRDELAALDAERARLEREIADDQERKHRLALLAARATELAGRLTSAVVVDSHAQPRDTVRFGAHVTIRSENGPDRRLKIVGVDEADAAAGRIAFVAPVARALLGRSVGDEVTLRTGRGDEPAEIVAIEYDEP